MLFAVGRAPICSDPAGRDRDLRRWGLKLAERGGKNARKRAVIAAARKLPVLLHKGKWGDLPGVVKMSFRVVSLSLAPGPRTHRLRELAGDTAVD
jgi:hypothetical protein